MIVKPDDMLERLKGEIISLKKQDLNVKIESQKTAGDLYLM